MICLCLVPAFGNITIVLRHGRAMRTLRSLTDPSLVGVGWCRCGLRDFCRRLCSARNRSGGGDGPSIGVCARAAHSKTGSAALPLFHACRARWAGSEFRPDVVVRAEAFEGRWAFARWEDLLVVEVNADARAVQWKRGETYPFTRTSKDALRRAERASPSRPF
jgi:hypothetical protein